MKEHIRYWSWRLGFGKERANVSETCKHFSSDGGHRSECGEKHPMF